MMTLVMDGINCNYFFSSFAVAAVVGLLARGEGDGNTIDILPTWLAFVWHAAEICFNLLLI